MREKNPKAGAVKGGLVGLLLGYPVSYFFQAGIVRQKFSLSDYLFNVGEVFDQAGGALDVVTPVIVGMIVSVSVGAIVGYLIAK